ncbi:hypothetical protein ACPPVU_05265 [Mucilaginibacter sp. McL0603]|uniref:hypothetical protein n=1 Tax=Mucilaginibacter sp. McL0603 TaxID=3415670 RepID=UPI003CECAC52
MKSLTEFGMTYVGSIINYSDLAKLAIQVAQKISEPNLSRRTTELANAHLNSKENYLKAYAKLNHLLVSLKNKSEIEKQSILPEVERAAYIFIVSGKNSLDMLACIMDILENKIVRPENKLPDFYSSNYVSASSDIKMLIDGVKTSVWADSLKEARNKILHRGYNIAIALNDTNNFEVLMTKTEIAFAEFENNIVLDAILGVELMKKNALDIESIMQGLSFDLCKFEYDVANKFVNENIIGLDSSLINNWVIPSFRLINNY